jgi:prevent-host-death family protein
MHETNASIGQVKSNISELVNRVAFGDERVVLTSHGHPKAVLIGLDDYQKLVTQETDADMTDWQAWLDQVNSLSADILERRGDQGVDVWGVDHVE